MKKFLFILPIVIGLFGATSCGKNQPAMYVKVMSYNIQHGIDHKKSKEQKITEVNLNGIVNIVEKYNPDILNVNEIYNTCSKFDIPEQVKYIAEQSGYNYYYFVHGDTIKWMDNGDYGGAIFSKFPIVGQSTHAIPNPESAPDLERRAIGKVAIKLPNGHTLNVLQSHFGGISDDASIRAKERENTINTLTPLVKDKASTVFMGDLNLVAGKDPDMTYVNKIKEMMNETIDESLPTFDSLNPTEHIDYMFCSHDLEFKDGKVLSDVFSDHLPIVCHIKA